MDHPQEVVFRIAVLWARSPITKIRGGMRITDGKILEISQGEAQAGGRSDVDLQGMHVIPGLIDAHQHFFVASLLPLHGNAGAWTSKDDALGAIETACRCAGSDVQWIFFSGLDNYKWKKPTLPLLTEIDAAAHGLPVLVVDSTCHKGLTSTEALRRAGISRDTMRRPIDIDIS